MYCTSKLDNVSRNRANHKQTGTLKYTHNHTCFHAYNVVIIGKNQMTKGLKYMTNFVEKRKNANVVIMRMSHRFDLEVLLCADNEVKMFNRKI